MRPSIKDIGNLGGQGGVEIPSNLHVQTYRSKKVLRWGRGVSRKNADVFYGWSLLGIGAILYMCQIGFITNCFQTQLCFLIRTII